MLKIHLTFQLDIGFGSSQNQHIRRKKIKLSRGKSELKGEITNDTPKYVHKIQSLYYLERKSFW